MRRAPSRLCLLAPMSFNGYRSKSAFGAIGFGIGVARVSRALGKVVKRVRTAERQLLVEASRYHKVTGFDLVVVSVRKHLWKRADAL